MKSVHFISLILILSNFNCTETTKPNKLINKEEKCLSIKNSAKVNLLNHTILFETIKEHEIESYRQKIEDSDLIEQFFGDEFENELYSDKGKRFIKELIISEEYISRKLIEDLDPPKSLLGVINLINKTKSKFFIRKGKKLIVDTDQKKVVFKDVTTNEDTWIKHSFIMHYPSINCYLIKKHEFVDGLHKNTQGILINKKTGKEVELWDTDFYISPNKEKIALATFSFGAEYSGKKGLQIFSNLNNNLAVISEIEICNWEPSVVGWIDNNQLLIKTVNDSDNDYGTVWIKNK